MSDEILSIKTEDVISFDTKQQITEPKKERKVEVPVFDLVPEDDPILRQVLPTFDFENPPVNPNQFALVIFISLSFIIDGLALIRLYSRLFLGPVLNQPQLNSYKRA